MDRSLHQISLTGKKETLLLTLSAKAFDNRSKHPILHDFRADEIATQINYDLAKFKRAAHGKHIILRARQLDEWLRTFLKANPQGVVLNLGCGLDTRITRIHPSPEVSWFDVDYPEVIALRQQFYSNHDGYTMIGSSVTDAQWLDTIPKTRPVMIIAEGLFEYLTTNDVQTLLTRFTDAFPHGEIAFDTFNSFAQRLQARTKPLTDVEVTWAVDTPDAVEQMNPKLKRIEDQPLFSSSPYRRELPWNYRILYSILAIFPQGKTLMRLLHYQF
jgi:O-methyltransferase involved in polyketide biosynthesis